MDAQRIITEARRWVGTPYHHQGRVSAGIDCAGLIIVVGRALGFFAPDFDVTHYGRNPTGILDGLLTAHLQRIDALVPGCIVSVRWWAESHHIGIVGQTADYLTLIHCHQGHAHRQHGNQGTAEHRLGAWHGKRITGAWCFPGAML